MSLLTAKLLEPCIVDGEIVLTEVHEDSVVERRLDELYALKSTKEEIDVFTDLTSSRWPLPGRIVCDHQELKDLKDIESRITRYLRKYIYLRNEKHYSVLAAWVISTYFRDEFNYAPILIFDGLTVCGKSTAVYTLSQICYRGSLFDSASGPAVAREIEDYGSTMLLDEVLDTLSGDRGADLYSMLKSSFTREGVWIRADPKGRKNYRYSTYSSIVLSIKGDSLPEDLYNRSIRVNMIPMPSDMKLADIYSWREDDSGLPDSPDTIRTDLYRLKAYSTAFPYRSSDKPFAEKAISFTQNRMIAKRDVTTMAENGQWLYAYVNDLPHNSPAIRARDRNIANTLYTIGLCVGSERDIISTIIENAEDQRETVLDAPEALAFLSLAELVHENWTPLQQFHVDITQDIFREIVRGINTSDVAKRFNEILLDQGNAQRDLVPTKTITAKLNAMGFAYSRRGGRGGNKSWFVPDNPYFIQLFVRNVKTFCPELYEHYKKLI